MHAVMLDNLEAYLADALEPAELRDFEAHLSTCNICREELHGMQDLSALLGVLRSDDTEAWDIAPGFAARVMEQVNRCKPALTFANVFAQAFGRRLAFASLVIAAVLGGYLVTHESQYPSGPSPEAILAQQTAPAFETGGAENNMLATLTAYEH